MAEQGRETLRLIDEVSQKNPEIERALLALSSLLASVEKEGALVNFYAAWQRQEDTLMARTGNEGWPRDYYDQLVQAMKECRAQLDAAPLGEANLAIEEINRRAIAIRNEAKENAPRPEVTERPRKKPFWKRFTKHG